jgi:hypothetical protein
MKADFNPKRVFAAATILTAFFILPVVSAEPVRADDGGSVDPETVMLVAGRTGAEIQQALDSLPPAGGEVILPAGDFEISQPVVLRRSNQSLRGAGSETVLRLADDANCPVIILGEPVNQPRRTISHLRVSELFIDGNRLNQSQELWQSTPAGSAIHNNGITVQGVSDSLVKNVTCARCRSGGLVTTLGVRRLTVEDFEAFDNEFDGLACYLTTDSRFVDLNLHDNPDAGISLDLAFDYNCITNAVLTANGLGIFMRASRDNRFQNISIRHSRHFGVFIAQTEVGTPHGCRPLPHSECIDNLFTALQATNCGGPVFHVNDSSCTNNVVGDAKMTVAFRDKLPPATHAAF